MTVRASTAPSTRSTKFGILCAERIYAMSIMIDLPPAMAQEAQEYATVQGTTLEQMLFDCIARDIEKQREAKRVMAEFDELVRKTSSRRTEPYVFSRADAYAETDR